MSLLLLSVILPLLGGTALAQQQQVIVAIRIHGNRRIPADSIRARMFTRPGDVYDPAAVERDFNSLWNSGYFDDLRIERQASPKGWILHVYVKEKPTIREIKYLGLTSISQSDVLSKFKELKVGLSQESPFDPTRVKRAEVVLKELLAAHGHQFATVTTEIREIPPAAVSITFNVKEGPKVKVGVIRFEGNKKVSSKYLRSAMTNLKPIGIPHSIILENLISKTYDATKLSEDAERVRLVCDAWGVTDLVTHELAHKLDMLNGPANGFPPLHRTMNRHAWTDAFSRAYTDLRQRIARGDFAALDPYGATNPAEFFAVASETFFAAPQALHAHYPQLYQQLCAFYRQQPLAV